MPSMYLISSNINIRRKICELLKEQLNHKHEQMIGDQDIEGNYNFPAMFTAV
jgi:hypothetical protein